MRFKPYAETAIGGPDCPDMRLFADIEKLMNHFPKNEDYGLDHRGERVVLTCHIVASAFAEICGDLVELTSGWFYPNFDHSWLMTKEGNIIDVYPVGMIGGPILVHKIVGGHYSKRKLYRYREIGATKDFNQQWFLKAVRRIARSLRMGAKKESMHILLQARTA